MVKTDLPLHLPKWAVLTGDSAVTLRTIPTESVQCVVTSPPYWGLRDYDAEGQLGVERTPSAYVEALVAVFAEVWRVLRNDGTVWLNLGDSYNNSGSCKNGTGLDGKQRGGATGAEGACGYKKKDTRYALKSEGVKVKDLVGIPWRVALALQAAGWYLRSDIIWAKPNPMPEPVTDRPSRSHEYVFLLTKQPHYFYDVDAVREPHRNDWYDRAKTWRNREAKQQQRGPSYHALGTVNPFANPPHPLGRHKRTIWTINPQPFAEAHFATFPLDLPLTCIKAGTSAYGACVSCGAPWKRVVEKRSEPNGTATAPGKSGALEGSAHYGQNKRRAVAGSFSNNPKLRPPPPRTKGWEPSCKCKHAAAVPCVVLDPFNGAGTTGVAALQLRQNYIGIELNPAYVKISTKRLRTELASRPKPLFREG